LPDEASVRGRYLIRTSDEEILLSFDAAIRGVAPRDRRTAVEELVSVVKASLPEAERDEGTAVALGILDHLGLGIDSLIIQVQQNVVNDFYRDARRHQIRYGSALQAGENEGHRLLELTKDLSREEVARLLERGDLGDQLMRIKEVQRRSLFSCLSCLYACQEAALFHVALELTGHDRWRAQSISHLPGLDGWRELFEMRGIPFGRNGLGLDGERFAKKAFDLRGQLTHGEDRYSSIVLAGGNPPPDPPQPSYEDATAWVDAVRDVLRRYTQLLGHPECAELGLWLVDVPQGF